jgi:hypothetical protein
MVVLRRRFKVEGTAERDKRRRGWRHPGTREIAIVASALKSGLDYRRAASMTR